MNKYTYVARDIAGKRIKGTFIAENEEYVKTALAKDDVFLISIKKASNSAPSSFFSFSNRVTIKELNSFSKQFSVLISSGISIIDALTTLKAQPYSSLLKRTLEKVIEDIYGGMMLSQSMKKYPKVFPSFYASMVYVGETSGQLDKVLVSVSDYYSREKKTRDKLRTALAYPAVLIVLMLAVVVVMMHVIIPTFISSFSTMGVEMPALTMALFNMSIFFREYWQFLALGVIALAFLIYLYSRTNGGRMFIDKLKISLPLFKKINMAVFTSHFVECLGLLLNSGLDIISALEATRSVVGNKYLEKQFVQVITDVKKGVPLSSAIDFEMKLSPVVTQMMLVGEKTGKLDSMLLSTTDYFEQEVEKSLGILTTTIQPIVLALLGGVIAVMFIAMYSPILNMITSVSA